MAEIKWNGTTKVTIDSRDVLEVLGEPTTEWRGGTCLGIGLMVRSILGMDGFVLSPGAGATGITVYRESGTCGTFSLFLVPGERDEEQIRVLEPGPDEEKSELVLDRVVYLSAYTRH